jgi:hypothetical protein
MAHVILTGTACPNPSVHHSMHASHAPVNGTSPTHRANASSEIDNCVVKVNHIGGPEMARGLVGGIGMGSFLALTSESLPQPDAVFGP